MNKLLAGIVGALVLAVTTAASAQSAPAPAAAPPAAAPAATPAPAPAAAPKAPPAAAADAMSGTAAWYGSKFNGRRTASGQRFNAAAMTAAHPSLPFGSKIKVTNAKNKRSVVVVINDRGPTTPGRIIDVSRAAATRLGFVRAGTTEVQLETVGSVKLARGK